MIQDQLKHQAESYTWHYTKRRTQKSTYETSKALDQYTRIYYSIKFKTNYAKYMYIAHFYPFLEIFSCFKD